MTLHNRSDSCTVYGGVAKRWDKPDSIKEQLTGTTVTPVMSFIDLAPGEGTFIRAVKEPSDESNVLKGRVAAGYTQGERSAGHNLGKQVF